MKKRVLVALLLVCALVLSGCALVVKDPVVDAGRTILEIGGETITKKAFLDEYTKAEENQKMMEQLYANYGMQAPQVSAEELLQKTIDSVVRQTVLNQKAKAMTLDVLTQEEEAKVQEDAKTHYENNLNSIKTQLFAGSTLEPAALEKAVSERAAKEGVSLEKIAEDVRQGMVQDKLRADTIKDVTVTAEEIKAEYDKRVADDKAKYDADINAYGKALLQGGTAYYAPEGYRYVKQVLVKFLPDDQTKIDAARSALTPLQKALADAQAAFDANETALKAENLSAEDTQSLTDKKAELQKALDEAKATAAVAEQSLTAATEAAYANIAEKAQGLYTRATGGESFDALVKEANEDTGMPEKGYAICKDFPDFDKAFVTPAMALAKPGDVAAPSKGIYGYYIVQYAGDVTPGAADIGTVQEKIQSELLSARQNEVFEKAVAQWTVEANVKAFPERVKD